MNLNTERFTVFDLPNQLFKIKIEKAKITIKEDKSTQGINNLVLFSFKFDVSKHKNKQEIKVPTVSTKAKKLFFKPKNISVQA